jgi:hypothetical protein
MNHRVSDAHRRGGASLVDDAETFVSTAYYRAGQPGQCIDHARCVGEILRELHCSDAVVAAGLLHDLVTDECATATELRGRFGDRVGDIVSCLTEDPALIDYRERKRALRQAARSGGLATMLILGADALARMQTIDEDGLPVAWLALEHYEQTLRMLVAAGIRSEHVDELRARVQQRRSAARAAIEAQQQSGRRQRRRQPAPQSHG